MTITNRETLYNNILKELICNLDTRSCTTYEIDEDMELWERSAGQLTIDARQFVWSDYESPLDMVSDNPDEIKAEVIRVFFAEDKEATPDLINKSIDELIEGDDAEIRIH